MNQIDQGPLPDNDFLQAQGGFLPFGRIVAGGQHLHQAVDFGFPGSLWCFLIRIPLMRGGITHPQVGLVGRIESFTVRLPGFASRSTASASSKVRVPAGSSAIAPGFRVTSV